MLLATVNGIEYIGLHPVVDEYTSENGKHVVCEVNAKNQ